MPEIFESEFMRLALGAGAVVGVLAPAVGFFLVQRRQSLVGDGIGHVAFAGVAAGILLDLPPVLTALVAAVLGGVAIELLRSRGGAAGDQALALVFYTGIAIGVVLVSLAGALDVDLFQYLFGSILTVTRADLVLVAALGAVGLATVGLLYRALAGVAVDEEGARVAGVPIGALNIAVATLAAVTVALSMRVVGILLVAALMVLPVSAASRVAWSMRSTFLLSLAIGLASALAGLTLSYYADLPPGGTIVLVAAAAFALAGGFGALRRG
jgi:zinc transport system permease protein